LSRAFLVRTGFPNQGSSGRMTGAGTDLKVAIGFFTLLTTFLIYRLI
jgi:hypothetical protein